MKVAVGMIVFNGNYVLKEALESIYPHVSQILISEGPVSFWQSQGYTTSTDGTNDVLNEFYDPDKKIKIIHGQFSEKDEQCNAYMSNLNDDTDYIWNLDSDEVFKSEDIETVFKLLKEKKYTSVGFKSCSFYGGFDHVLGGFEENSEFIRIRKVYPGSYWKTHRPPTIAHRSKITLPESHLNFNTLYREHGVKMYHYSYVFPDQVKQKIHYYKKSVSKNNCIDDYFENIYLPWVQNHNREMIENMYSGVHEFKPSFRGECRTKIFEDEHPVLVQKNMEILKQKFKKQLESYI